MRPVGPLVEKEQTVRAKELAQRSRVRAGHLLHPGLVADLREVIALNQRDEGWEESSVVTSAARFRLAVSLTTATRGTARRRISGRRAEGQDRNQTPKMRRAACSLFSIVRSFRQLRNRRSTIWSAAFSSASLPAVRLPDVDGNLGIAVAPEQLLARAADDVHLDASAAGNQVAVAGAELAVGSPVMAMAAFLWV